jgi:hypothetical protein
LPFFPCAIIAGFCACGSFALAGAVKEKLLIKLHNVFGEIREDDSSFLQTLFS